LRYEEAGIIQWKDCQGVRVYLRLPDGSLLPESLWDASMEFRLGTSASNAVKLWRENERHQGVQCGGDTGLGA
jgi:hypothetical protein